MTDIRDRFLADVADHEMKILHEDGIYRHLRFMPPKGSSYWFDLHTSPGLLVISGDMGCYAFSRIEDMFEFFRGDRINPHYWSEKLRSAGRDGVRSYSEDLFRQLVAEHVADYSDVPGLADAVRRELLDDGYHAPDLSYEEGARAALNDFTHKYEKGGRTYPWAFEDTWEWDFRDWTSQFLWCCHAIAWGIERYDAAKDGSARAE